MGEGTREELDRTSDREQLDGVREPRLSYLRHLPVRVADNDEAIDADHDDRADL